ncbi:hypothetical protein GH714_017407 [Hevea brasiliensis]|uniref:Amidohydrolase 3 domain-containing protein n=1 Tax=Hevea brasiliensis TaxID=3981 RepID=A0A6A6NAU4_HEVBR|nr:hypothetical protein GH714_017407 [Hevea brasiliensis]
MQNFAGDKTKVLDLEGKVVVPGFIDSHVHFIYGGLQMMRVELRGVNGKDEFVRRVREAVTNLEEGSWVLGGGWNNDLWGGELPVASWIDDITPKNPVWLTRMDGHMGLANSMALKLAGISSLLQNPNGGTILRSADGEPTGLLCCNETHSALDPRGGVKGFADGSLGSNSALFYEPYSDEPHNYGLQITNVENLFNMTVASDKAGLQVAIHAIGDKANDMVLDMYESVVLTNGKRDRRFRIEHAQHLSPGTISRFGEQGIIASVQPDHLLDDADSARKKLGMDRAERGSYQLQSLLASNAQLALGSDWPVVHINPLRSIKTAMKRIPPGWENAWIPSECLSLKDAIIAHTISAAYACFLDDDLGSLSPGKLADFVMLSTSSWDDFETEASASVEATYIAGSQAYP